MSGKTLSLTYQEEEASSSPTLREADALYLVLEGERPLSGGLRIGLDDVDEVRFGRGRERSVAREGRALVVSVPDPRMSGSHAKLTREGAGFVLEDLASTNGSFVSGARVTRERLGAGGETVFTLGATVLLLAREEVPPKVPDVIESASRASYPRGMRTLVPRHEQTLPNLVRVASSSLPILLLGESGSGKEVLARSIHELSRKEGPFVAINCGALSPQLVEGLLFGHVRGAFSGALKDELGLVRSADKGTLFLDEVGELPAPAQATLLRVLQEKEVLPVGATKAVPVDVRVVAATLRPIDESSTFRRDLYARLAAFVRRIPTLRERKGDLGLLVADLLRKIAPDRAELYRLAPELATALVLYDWPLNVRELEHVLSVATVTAATALLRPEHVGETLPLRKPRPSAADDGAIRAGAAPSGAAASAPPSDGADGPARPLSEAEERTKAELVALLEKTAGNVSEVSRLMGKTRMQIHRWAKRFGVDLEAHRR